MACKASSSTKSLTVSPSEWPSSISAEESQRECRDSSGERRLPACSVRQLAERTGIRFKRRDQKLLAPGCRQRQAGSLCSPEMSAIIIRGGRIIDPANNRDEVADL